MPLKIDTLVEITVRLSYRVQVTWTCCLLILSACGPTTTKAAPAAAAEPTTAQVIALRDTYGRWILNQPGVVLPTDHAALDDALARQDWTYISQAAQSSNSQDQAERMLSWERYQLYRGGGYGIGYMYARDLWRIGASYEKAAAKGPQYAAQAKALKTSALTYLLYSYALIAVDGERCGDPSAPQSHRDQIARFSTEPLAFTDQLTPEERAKAVATAITLEQKIAPVRDLDTALCKGGIKDLGQALDTNSGAAKTRSHQPGYPGTTVDVQIDPHGAPLLIDAAQWPARRQAARDRLTSTIGSVVGLKPPA